MSNTTLNASLSLLGSEVFTAAEAPTGGNQAARTITIAGQDVSAILDATTLPKVETPPIVRKITISGTTTIDLTAAAGVTVPASATRTIDATGKKLIAMRLTCPITNAAVVNVAPGGSNPYPFKGAANDVDVRPGESVLSIITGIASGYPAVSSTVKNIDVTGTTNDVLHVELYFGT